MLALTRRKGEKVIIDGTITITVVEIQGQKVKLSFDAPCDVVIDREEVHKAKKESAHVAA